MTFSEPCSAHGGVLCASCCELGTFSSQSGTVHVQAEAFAFMPHWMGSAFAARGGAGWWTLRPPALVMGHAVWLPYDKIFKAYVWKALGLWNWKAELVRFTHQHLTHPDLCKDRILPETRCLSSGFWGVLSAHRRHMMS